MHNHLERSLGKLNLSPKVELKFCHFPSPWLKEGSQKPSELAVGEQVNSPFPTPLRPTPPIFSLLYCSLQYCSADPLQSMMCGGGKGSPPPHLLGEVTALPRPPGHDFKISKFQKYQNFKISKFQNFKTSIFNFLRNTK